MALQPAPRSVQYTGSRKSHVRRNKRISLVVLVAAAICLIAGASVWLIMRFGVYKDYKVTATIDLSNSDEHTSYYPYLNGYVKVAGDGISYFDKKGVMWTETFEMTQPIVDVCGSYVAIADMKTTDVCLFDESGLANRITIPRSITAVQVSKQGVIAVATNENESNYIEVLDKDGKELITSKSVFSSSGYLMDISLADDGSKLAAVYVYVSEGTTTSKVVFYDFTKGNAGENIIVGGFNQYESIILTAVEFMEGNKVCVVGSGAFSIYDISGSPEIVYEDLEMPWQIQSLFFSGRHVGFIVLDETTDNNYCIKVFDLRGKLVMDKGFDFAYTHAAFAEKNVLLYSSNDCEIYSFASVKKFSHTFEDRIAYMLSCGNGRNFIYAKSDSTQFIKLK